MLDFPRGDIDQERQWRELMWFHLTTHPEWPDFRAQTLRDLGVYGGASGIWSDLESTKSIVNNGVAVSILHTGHHYEDDLDDRGILYFYPVTNRAGLRDQNEIQSVKNAMLLNLPVFVVIKIGTFREVRRAWVADFDDASSQFLFEFSSEATKSEVEFDLPFEAQSSRRRKPDLILRIERNPRFKFEVARRFRGLCAVTELAVPKMLEAAHVVPVAKGGSDDPRNGLLLSASHHRAYDRHLWTINPRTLAIETRPNGPTLEQMRFRHRTLEHLAEKQCLPHYEALDAGYELFRDAVGL